MIEKLENRCLMSASAKLVDGTLIIRGTDGEDVIGVSSMSLFVTHNGSLSNFLDASAIISVSINGLGTQQFDLADVDQILIKSLDGNDRITMGDNGQLSFGHVNIGAEIRAGGGDYIVRGTFAGDTIKGGDGNDTLIGMRGDDQIYGGAGEDLIKGAGGDDFLHAGSGNDRLKDYRGVNVFHGGSGRDSGLVDPELLGSGVENRQMGQIINGKLSTNDLDPLVTGTNIFWKDGRLFLDYHFRVGSAGYDVRYSDFRLVLVGGMLEVQVTVTKPNGPVVTMSANHSHRWDITGAEVNGLIFTKIEIQKGSPEDNIPDTEKRQSNVLIQQQTGVRLEPPPDFIMRR